MNYLNLPWNRWYVLKSYVGASLWIVPVVVMVAGIAGLAVIVARSRRRRSEDGDHEISQEDRELVAAALEPSASGTVSADDNPN